MKKLMLLALAAMLSTATVTQSFAQDKVKKECTCKKCSDKCKEECKDECKNGKCTHEECKQKCDDGKGCKKQA